MHTRNIARAACAVLFAAALATPSLAAAKHHKKHGKPPGIAQMMLPQEAVWMGDPFLMPVADPHSAFIAMNRIEADMNQMAAAMDREMEAAFAQARDMTAEPGLSDATLYNMETRAAPGESISVVTTSFGGGNSCTRTVQVTTAGNDAKPQMVSHSYGNCGADNPASADAGLIQAGVRLPAGTAPHHPPV